MSVRLLNIPSLTDSPADQFKRLGVPTRVDVLTAEDNVWVPYAASLLYRARAFLKANRQKLFARHYTIGDVKIFIRIGPGSEYIQIRAGEPGSFYVVPVVFKISTAATTTGDPAFLNSALTKASPVEIDLEIPSMFPHGAPNRKIFAGASDGVDRGYLSGQTLITGGNAKVANTAGVFRHTYIEDDVAKVEFLHGVAGPTDPTPSNNDGLWYHSAALGDQLVRFVDLPIDRRPALHVSMFASKDGKKIVAEEQFAPDLVPDPGYDDWFILRSIIDVDLGNPDNPVVVSDFSNPGVYPGSTFELGGTGSTVADSTGAGTFESPHISTFIGELTYPVSTAIDSANELIQTIVLLEYNYRNEFSFASSGNFAIGITTHRKVSTSSPATIRVEAPGMGIDIPFNFTGNNREIEFEATEFFFPTSYSISTLVPPFSDTSGVAGGNASVLQFAFSNTAHKAIVYLLDEVYGNNEYGEIFGSPSGYSVPRTRTVVRTRRIVAHVGTATHVLSDVIEEAAPVGPTDVIIATEFPDAGVPTGVTLPSATHPNLYFRANRTLGDFVQVATIDSTKYIGSVKLPPDPFSDADEDREWFTFSHNDAALKKTIVNHVLEPAEPIEGAALDDYKIWFTVIRAI
jgi:hypothetical protein